MSVFLRWGIFGILAVAGLLYAYNASKRMTEARASREVSAREMGPISEPAPEPEPGPPLQARAAPPSAPPHCEAELVVARRALQARRQGEPLDRLLRIQEIAFQEPARRARLTKVATDWFNHEGPEPIPEAMRIGVISHCVMTSPAP